MGYGDLLPKVELSYDNVPFGYSMCHSKLCKIRHTSFALKYSPPQVGVARNSCACHCAHCTLWCQIAVLYELTGPDGKVEDKRYHVIRVPLTATTPDLTSVCIDLVDKHEGALALLLERGLCSPQ